MSGVLACKEGALQGRLTDLRGGLSRRVLSEALKVGKGWGRDLVLEGSYKQFLVGLLQIPSPGGSGAQRRDHLGRGQVETWHELLIGAEVHGHVDLFAGLAGLLPWLLMKHSAVYGISYCIQFLFPFNLKLPSPLFLGLLDFRQGQKLARWVDGKFFLSLNSVQVSIHIEI